MFIYIITTGTDLYTYNIKFAKSFHKFAPSLNLYF